MSNVRLLPIASALLTLTLLASCHNEEEIEYRQYFVNGKRLYEQQCQNCHGAKGEGLKSLYPPLTDSSYLAANRLILPCIIRHGQKGRIIINGQEYDGGMPANPTLTDMEIAQIIVYITNSFGNSQGMFQPSDVRKQTELCL